MLSYWYGYNWRPCDKCGNMFPEWLATCKSKTRVLNLPALFVQKKRKLMGFWGFPKFCLHCSKTLMPNYCLMSHVKCFHIDMDTSEDLVTNVATCSMNWLVYCKSDTRVLNLPALFVQEKRKLMGLWGFPYFHMTVINNGLMTCVVNTFHDCWWGENITINLKNPFFRINMNFRHDLSNIDWILKFLHKCYTEQWVSRKSGPFDSRL